MWSTGVVLSTPSELPTGHTKGVLVSAACHQGVAFWSVM